MIGVDETAVTVASDRREFLESLRSWEIDLATSNVDYLVEFDPPRPGARSGVRYLPRLRHGSRDLFRLRDVALLEHVTRRVLGSFANTPDDSLLRVGLMPLVADGRALLVPPVHGGAMSHRWYGNEGISPQYTASCLVHLDRWEAAVSPALGDEDDLEWWPIADWWLPSADPDADLGPGEAVAHVMRFAVVPGAPMAGHVLGQVAAAVSRQAPRLVALAPDTVLEQFDPPRAARRRRRLGEALSAAFAAT